VIGKTIGPYQILAELGRGGMGVVYRARDTKLNRDVAIKVLPEAFALDADRLARFTREAQVLASLNHPNIASIYGIEEFRKMTSGVFSADTQSEETPDVIFPATEVLSRALVMELVEGQDLSQLIGTLETQGALRIAAQIADALEAAHEQGIVHRDLKPQNIKVRADGTVKVLDFGLARTLDPGPGTLDPQNSPTMTARATAMGMIIGTAAYMAPEQAKGKAVGKRADIWAFGVVLFEMLTGRQVFAGGEITEVLASVLKDAPDFTTLPVDTPVSVRRLLRRCLEKDPRERLGDISVARLEIRDAAVPSDAPPAASRPTMWRSVAIGLAALAAVLAGMVAIPRFTAPATDAGPAASVRFPLSNDPALRISTDMTQPFAVSPDGRTVVFRADDGRGGHLWVRTLDAVEPRRLDNTEGAMQPAISPDGEWVAFVVANYRIRKVRLAGGIASEIASIDNVTAALTWLSNEEIAFEMIGTLDGIHRVSTNGGTPTLMLPLDAGSGERSQRRPVALRELGILLYTSNDHQPSRTLTAVSLADGRRVPLNVNGVQALGVIEEHLIYSREDGVLMAVPFDVASMQTRGEARQLVDQVERTGTGTAVSMSQSGTLVFSAPGGQAARLLVRDGSGKTAPIGDWVRAFDVARFSPKGDRVAVAIGEGDNRELWVVDLALAEPSRVTSAAYDSLVDWTDDGLALIHMRNWQVWMTPVDGRAAPKQLVKLDGRITAASIVPGGESVVAVRLNQGALAGLSLVSIKTGAETPIVADASSGLRPRPIDARVSPDGQWVAYTDRNQQEVHVHSLRGTGTIQLSAQGGTQPVWARDSRQVFYRAGADLMVARVRTEPSLAFVSRARVGATGFPGVVQDVAPNGTSFLVAEPVSQVPGVFVASGWAGDLRRQLGK
jgi:Tol biopolymer transport system component